MLAAIALIAADSDIEDSTTTLFELSPAVVAILVGTALPLLVGLVTKVSTNSGVKAVLLLVLSAVTGLVTQAITDDGGAVFTQEAVIAAFVAFVTAVAMHFGVWKPTGTTAQVQAVGVKDP